MAEELQADGGGVWWLNSPRNFFSGHCSPVIFDSIVDHHGFWNWNQDLHYGDGRNSPMIGALETKFDHSQSSESSCHDSYDQPNPFGSSSSLLENLISTEMSYISSQGYFRNLNSVGLPENHMHLTGVGEIPMNFLRSTHPHSLAQSCDYTLKANQNNFNSKNPKEETCKSSTNEPPLKRPRVATPTFKVRKERLGDRVSALQQLVSPFGKTDTASVLHEAIEYIKYLHDQVHVLTSPYFKNKSPPLKLKQITQNAMNQERSNGSLMNRGLCLMPISTTVPVTNERSTDFWTPTFGGSSRNGDVREVMLM